MIFAGGVVNPPVSFADSPLYTRGPLSSLNSDLLRRKETCKISIQFYQLDLISIGSSCIMGRIIETENKWEVKT